MTKALINLDLDVFISRRNLIRTSSGKKDVAYFCWVGLLPCVFCLLAAVLCVFATCAGPALSPAARAPATPSSSRGNGYVPALLHTGSSESEVEKKTDHIPFPDGHGWESSSLGEAAWFWKMQSLTEIPRL